MSADLDLQTTTNLQLTAFVFSRSPDGITWWLHILGFDILSQSFNRWRRNSASKPGALSK